MIDLTKVKRRAKRLAVDPETGTYPQMQAGLRAGEDVRYFEQREADLLEQRDQIDRELQELQARANR